MNKWLQSVVVAGVVIGLGAGGWAVATNNRKIEARASVAELMSDSDTSGFARAYTPRDFKFPQDHGPHNEFQTEWWYYTGNVADANGRHFGYQFTIFRRAIAAEANANPIAANSFTSNQVYFAHFAITDSGAGKHSAFERFSRSGGNLAGAIAAPFHVFIEDWSVQSSMSTGGAEAVEIKAKDSRNGGEYAIQLNLNASKPLALHGERGLSAKSNLLGNASYYYSFTRMATTGKISTPSGTFEVRGDSWMDREWSTSALSANTAGWDWFSVQLGDQREVMLYLLRLKDGSIDSVSKGTLIEADGSTHNLKLEDFKVDVLDRWRSPHNNADYPMRWRLSIPSAGILIELTPRIKDQEMADISTVYWEGAVTLAGTSNGKTVNGVGYVEMTGYQAGLNRRL